MPCQTALFCSFLLFNDHFLNTNFDFDTSGGKTIRKLLNGNKIASIWLRFCDERVRRHKRGRNTITHTGECSGMKHHFDSDGVVEISKFDISKLTCNAFGFSTALEKQNLFYQRFTFVNNRLAYASSIAT